jgi:hypothetical protein
MGTVERVVVVVALILPVLLVRNVLLSEALDWAVLGLYAAFKLATRPNRRE